MQSQFLKPPQDSGCGNRCQLGSWNSICVGGSGHPQAMQSILAFPPTGSSSQRILVGKSKQIRIFTVITQHFLSLTCQEFCGGIFLTSLKITSNGRWSYEVTSDLLESSVTVCQKPILGVAWCCLAISHLHQLELKVMKSKLLSTVQIPKRGFEIQNPRKTQPCLLSLAPAPVIGILSFQVISECYDDDE